MSVEAIEKLLRMVERSFDEVPRNEYEANNRYFSNVERLTEAREKLSAFSGARINDLHSRLEALACTNEAHKTGGLSTGPLGAAAEGTSSNAFSLDFLGADAGNLGDVDEELTKAEESLAKEAKKRKDKKSKKSSRSDKVKGESKEQKGTQQAIEDAPDEEGRGIVASDWPCTQEDVHTASPLPAVLEPNESIISTDKECPSIAVPAALSGAMGVCGLVQDTPLAKVDFPSVVLDLDGIPCHCRVELYRGVLVALAYGTPAAAATDGTDAPTTRAWERPQPETQEANEEEGDAEDGEDGEVEESDQESHAAQLQELSRELVLQYEAAQAEKEEVENRSSFPKEFPARLVPQLRSATYLPWVVLMCLGGYFAGGVFVKGKCVKHKAFQRYVVRKKQGGRQSTNAKDGGGSYGSIGSQIRAAQEVKWKIDVRDILITWRPDIDAAAFILYAAPGPQNRLMLTDFSSLPPPPSGKRVESPISLQDPRVQRVPLSTHKPTFQEVERVYETVSKYNLIYLRAENDEKC